MLQKGTLQELIELKGCIIIAEACDNHFGSLDRAKRMIQAASASGADIIKFQHHIAEEEMLKEVPRSGNFKGESLFEFLEKYALSIEDHVELINVCEENNIHYLCTPFSLAAAIQLKQIGQTVFKIGSGEFLDHWYLDKLSEFCDALIVSTGMVNYEELEDGVNYLNQQYDELYVLNCTSESPPVYEDIKLGNIQKLQLLWPDIVIGHSDHTPDLFTSFAAIASGAKIIEKHFYVDEDIIGPDTDVSISPKELAELCIGRDKIVAAMGAGKKVNDLEKPIRAWAHRSVVSTRGLKQGDYLTEKDIKTKRPGNGIPSREYKELIGKRLTSDINENQIIQWEDVDANSVC